MRSLFADNPLCRWIDVDGCTRYSRFSRIKSDERSRFLERAGWAVAADLVKDEDRCNARPEALVAADWCELDGGRPSLAHDIRTIVDRLLTWRTKEGRLLKLHEMSTEHLLNVKAMPNTRSWHSA